MEGIGWDQARMPELDPASAASVKPGEVKVTCQIRGNRS